VKRKIIIRKIQKRWKLYKKSYFYLTKILKWEMRENERLSLHRRFPFLPRTCIDYVINDQDLIWTPSENNPRISWETMKNYQDIPYKNWKGIYSLLIYSLLLISCFNYKLFR